jgi:hypothetical protein
MTDDYDDYDDVSYADAMGELIEEAMREASADNVRDYVCRCGDAVEERVQALLGQAHDLLSHGFQGPATTVAVTASELIIRFLLLRPLVQGAFLDDIWAQILTERVVRGRSADDRALLPRVLRGWDIDITTKRCRSQAMMWQSLQDIVRKKRDAFVHLGEPVGEDAAQLAVECSEALLDVAHQVGLKFGCGPAATGTWHQAASESGFLEHTRSYETLNPFQ